MAKKVITLFDIDKAVRPDVKVLKLITGEEIIARVTERDAGFITLYRPLMFQTIVTKKGEDWSGTLIPWLKTSLDEKMIIPSEHILFESNPTDEVEKYYLSSITGLIL